jgi:hypothetical protein
LIGVVFMKSSVNVCVCGGDIRADQLNSRLPTPLSCMHTPTALAPPSPDPPSDILILTPFFSRYCRYVNKPFNKKGTELLTAVRGKHYKAEVTAMPFVPTRYYKP